MQPSYLHRITLRQMEIFLAVCQTRHYSRAADQLALTQPAVSSQIRQIEKLIGEPLFHYVGKQVSITAAGELLERAARDIRQRLISTEMELSELGGNIQGTLHIAVETSAQYFVPVVVAKFRKAFPMVSVEIDISNRADTLKSLYDNRAELVIAGSPTADRAVDFTPFRDDEIVAVAHPAHPLVNAGQVSLLTLSQQTLLTRESGSGTRLILEDLAREEAVKLDNVQHYGSLEAIKAAVKSQSGVALLPLDCCREDIDSQNLAVLPMQNFPLKRSWCTMKLRHRQLTPVTDRFLKYLLAADRD